MLEYGKIKGIYKEKLAWLAKDRTVSDILSEHKIYVYQNKMHEYFVGIINSEPGRGLYLAEHKLSVLDSKENNVGFVKFTQEDEENAYVGSLRVKEDLINRGLGRLMMVHTMEFLTDTLGYGSKDKEIGIIASGCAVVDIKENVTRQDRLNHRDRLVKFYGSLGFDRCNNIDAVEASMRYDPIKGFDSLKNKRKGDVLIKTF